MVASFDLTFNLNLVCFEMSYYVNLLLQTSLIALIALVAITGDYLVSLSPSKITRAIFDNATHCIIGGLSWFLVSLLCKRYSLFEIVLCALAASLIDLDHFLVARSLHLKDATSLKQRPFLHCSTVPLVTCVLLSGTSYVLHCNGLKQVNLILLTAFVSHHTRDATRRGYWFFPFKSTPPVPYNFYIILTCLLPYLIYFFDRRVLNITKDYKFASLDSSIEV